MSRYRILLLALLCLVLSSCGEPEPYRKPTYPVTGKVTVDGAAPGSAIQVFCENVGGMDEQHPTYSQSETKEDGSFAISTYESGDGVPAGDYVITFVWQDFNLMSRQYGGPDKLNKRYNDPKTSEFKVTVKEGEPTDMGTIALTTK